MIEAEAKVRAPHEPVEERLTELDAEHVTDKKQVDVYFAAPHRDFADTDEALRVRHENGRAYVTYKGPKLDAETKTREEHETEVGDAETAVAVFESLGFDEFGRVSKQRSVYELDGKTVVLDEVDGLGSFVEVEVEAENSTEEATQDVFGTVEDLGLEPEASVRESYLELLYS
jgi:adenylate cyclase class 2